MGPVLLGHAATEDLPIPRDAFVRPPQCMFPFHPSLPSLSWHLAMCRLLGLGGQKRICRDFLAARSFLWEPSIPSPCAGPSVSGPGRFNREPPSSTPPLAVSLPL